MFFVFDFNFGSNVGEDSLAVFDFEDGVLDASPELFEEFGEFGAEFIFPDIVNDEEHGFSPILCY